MHRFWEHLFDLTNITLGTSNFDLTPFINKVEFTNENRYIKEIKRVH